MSAPVNPLTAAEALRFSAVLRQLLGALDGEIVVAALVGDREPDLLDTERQEVNRVREFLDGRISMRSEPSDLRSCGLAVLDAFASELKATTEVHDSSPSSGTSTVGENPSSIGPNHRIPPTQGAQL